MNQSPRLLARFNRSLACGGHGSPPAAQETLNVYNWTGFVAPDTVANFERETGIKVLYDTYESDEVLETKLLTGRTNYDVVGVPYVWTTTGIGYNVDKVRERLGSVELESWSLLLDPQNAVKLQDCGISMLDSPTDVVSSVLIYLGKDPNSRDMADLDAAADTLMKIRPFVRTIVSVGNIVDLANGNVCVVLGWGSDMVLARYRALEAGNGVKIRYFIPHEGGLVGNDILAIAADAPHPQNAEKWLNYLMRPEVIADITNALKYPNGNRASLPFVQDAIKNDPALYPDTETRTKLHTLQSMPPDFARSVTRVWTRFRTGQ